MFYHPAVKIENTINIIQMFIQSVDREVSILYQVLVLAMVSLVKKKQTFKYINICRLLIIFIAYYADTELCSSLRTSPELPSSLTPDETPTSTGSSLSPPGAGVDNGMPIK